MAKDSFKVKKSLNIEPKSSPTLDAEGDVGFNATSHKLEIRDNSTTKSVVTEDGSATLTNKTIDGASNTLSNIPSSSLDLASGTSINVATTNTNSSVNIGTGTGTNTINIGGANTTVNITGTVNSQNVTNLEVSDKLITINNGGAAGSGAVAGIEIEENGSATGYVATSADRNSWEFKAPNKAGVVSVTPPTSGTDSIVLESATQTLSNKTIATPTITGTITASNLTADRAIATGSGGVISASATTSTELGYLSGVTSGVQSQLNGKVNKYLSNLDSTTNVNATLKPQAANTYDLGSSSYPWAEVFSAYSQANEEMRSPLFKAKENLIGSTKYVNIYGPASMASSYDLKLPSSQGTAKSVLTNDGSGNLTWVAGEIGAAKGESLVLAASSPTLNGAAILQADSTSKGFLPPRMTQAQRDAIASPVAGLSIYNTDTNKLNIHNGTSWGEVGSGGGGINYIASSDGNGSTGWATYADAAGTDPVDGTGGSAGVTFATSTNSDLRGTTNFLFTHQAANRQGQGFSYNFTIDKADQAKMLQIRFDYLVASGTYADGDLTVWVYDVTNSKLIQPAPYKILNAVGVQPWIGEFQTASNSTSYRLIFHVTTNTATAYTMRFDNFSVGPQMNRAYGTPITDWVSYTPTFNGTGVAIGNGTLTGYYRRVGDSISLSIKMVAGSTTNFGSGYWSFSLPPGLTMNTSKMANSVGNVSIKGLARARDVSAASGWSGKAAYYNDTTLTANFDFYNVHTGLAPIRYDDNGIVNNGFPFTWASTDILEIDAYEIPITGWSSNTIMSSDAATNVVAATTGSESYITLNQSVTSILKFGGKGIDTNNGITLEAGSFTASTGVWSTTNPKYTIPVSGYYYIRALVKRKFTTNNTSNTHSVYIYRNGSAVSSYSMNEDGSNSSGLGFNLQPIADIMTLNAGDYIDIRVNSDTANGVTDAMLSHMEIFKISGPTQIAASETVAVEVNTTAGYSIANNTWTQLTFENTESSTHSAWNSNVFTAPNSGRYLIAANINFNSNGTGIRAFEIYANANTVLQIVNQTVSGADFSLSGAKVVKLLAGQTVKMNVYQNCGTSLSLTTNAGRNTLSIIRVGNY